jgi:hypothetical protein
MALARVCDGCDRALTEGNYFDVMVTPKKVSQSPDQDSEHSYGDFCVGCVADGTATKLLLTEALEGNGEPKPK